MTSSKISCLVWVAVLSILFIAWPAKSGAWVPARQALYFKIAFNEFSTDNAFDEFGDEVNASRFEDRNLSLYAEYGLPAGLGLFASLAYKDLRQDGEVVQSNRGFSDLELGIRRVLWKRKSVLSISGAMKLPYLYQRREAMPLGNGQEDFELRLLFGRGIGQFYYGIESGYRWRLEEPADEFRYLLEVGASFDHVYWRSKIDGIESAGNGQTDRTVDNPSLQNDFDLVKWETTLGVSWTHKMDLEFTYTNSIDGRNALAGDQFQLGLVLKR